MVVYVRKLDEAAELAALERVPTESIQKMSQVESLEQNLVFLDDTEFRGYGRDRGQRMVRPKEGIFGYGRLESFVGVRRVLVGDDS
ncbi:hypothetical protein U1Q18_038504 [Sarracenia purpurea var. burkii]